MAKCKVWNMHGLGMTHTEMFKGDKIVIPPGQFIEMDYEDAVLFKGQYFPMKKKPTGEDDPASWKMIKLEPIGSEAPMTAKAEFICQKDGLKFPTQASLDFHIKQNYADEIVKDETIEKEIAEEKASKIQAPTRKGKSA